METKGIYTLDNVSPTWCTAWCESKIIIAVGSLDMPWKLELFFPDSNTPSSFAPSPSLFSWITLCLFSIPYFFVIFSLLCSSSCQSFQLPLSIPFFPVLGFLVQSYRLFQPISNLTFPSSVILKTLPAFPTLSKCCFSFFLLLYFFFSLSLENFSFIPSSYIGILLMISSTCPRWKH